MTVDAVDSQDATSCRRFLDLLRCPMSGARLRCESDALVSVGGTRRYRVAAGGIPVFAESATSMDSEAQRRHYDKVAAAYSSNLGYPHTQEYFAYLDRKVIEAIGDGELGTVAELCCGRGEALMLLGGRVRRYVGLDISETMLAETTRQRHHPEALFVQGDATHVPLADESIDTVVMLGGVHHVPARARLFAEIARILKPGGRFVYREPVSDFLVWRGLRAIIYRLSPMLEHDTERPLVYAETVPVMEAAGLHSLLYRTYGFLGFCLFMNSDVLLFNRLFRFVPGIRAITRAFARLDETFIALPGFSRAGLQVVGIARKASGERIQ